MNKADISDVETTEVTLHGERFQVSLNTKWDRGFWEDFKDKLPQQLALVSTSGIV
jgi:23S rRNA G2069 N7-methylase RlmK/C1962 C5-methylase RlmI